MTISAAVRTRPRNRHLMERRLSKSFDTGLDMCHMEDPHHLRVQSSPNLNTSRSDIRQPISSLPLLINGDTGSGTAHSSISDFLDDPLSILRYQTWRKIQGNISREKRLAGVTCILITVFILCYLPFWSTYICLVSYKLQR